ncbi:MAG: hypothetical protein [Caudoviricetes sp.]|nr:MAG: hypothetical protein [Caudoviricetes sp.]
MMTPLANTLNKTELSIDNSVLLKFPNLTSQGIWNVKLSYILFDGFGTIQYIDENLFETGFLVQWSNMHESMIIDANESYKWKIDHIIYNNVNYTTLLEDTFKQLHLYSDNHNINDNNYRDLAIFYFKLFNLYDKLKSNIINKTLIDGISKIYEYDDDEYNIYRI